MVFRKRYTSKRRPRRGKKMMRRKRRVPRTINQNSITIWQSNLNDTIISNSSAAVTTGSFTFQLSFVQNYNTYVQIYDYYKINKVSLKFYPVTADNRDYSSSTPNLAQNLPYFYTCIDRDDNTAPFDAAEVRAYGNSKTRHCNRPFTMNIKPSVLSVIYNSITSNAYKITPSTKLDLGYPFVPHFGIKYAMDACSPTGAYTYRVEIDYNITYSGRRK
uniref:Capsid protein n=1 Tax=Diporeia sp. associated circular virus TaxID=1299317 RepID=M1TG64_9VIRU|nr:capsid protein [Diporeia sp. associated circular virus]